MNVYVMTMFLVFIFGILEYQMRMQTKEYNLEQEKTRYREPINRYFVLLVSVLLFVGGFRFQVGSDYVAYASTYIETKASIVNLLRNFDEPVIYIITYACRSIWNEGAIVIFVENAISVLLVMKGIRDFEEESYVLPVLLYIMYCGWVSSFGAVRQCMAASVIFAFSKRRDDRLWILQYILVVFVAFLIHKSAICMLPILIVANRRVDYKQILIVIFSAFMIPYLGTRALQFMGTTIEGAYATHSVNIVRIFVSVVPAILALVSSEKFKEKNAFVINMTLINTIITFTTRNSALMYRFSDFTCMYLMLFIPKCTAFFTKQSKRAYQIIVFLLYFFYFYMEVKTGNGGLRRFQWIFNHLGVY